MSKDYNINCTQYLYVHTVFVDIHCVCNLVIRCRNAWKICMKSLQVLRKGRETNRKISSNICSLTFCKVAKTFAQPATYTAIINCTLQQWFCTAKFMQWLFDKMSFLENNFLTILFVFNDLTLLVGG
jgi:hypothetical protein